MITTGTSTTEEDSIAKFTIEILHQLCDHVSMVDKIEIYEGQQSNPPRKGLLLLDLRRNCAGAGCWVSRRPAALILATSEQQKHRTRIRNGVSTLSDVWIG